MGAIVAVDQAGFPGALWGRQRHSEDPLLAVVVEIDRGAPYSRTRIRCLDGECEAWVADDDLLPLVTTPLLIHVRI